MFHIRCYSLSTGLSTLELKYLIYVLFNSRKRRNTVVEDEQYRSEDAES